jgi:hypothetical protein
LRHACHSLFRPAFGPHESFRARASAGRVGIAHHTAIPFQSMVGGAHPTWLISPGSGIVFPVAQKNLQGTQGRWKQIVKRGHHLADPDQRHDKDSRAKTRFVSVRKCRAVTVNAPAVLFESVQIHSDPHQSPFWIKAMGLLRWGGQAPGPWLTRAPENRRCPTKVQVDHGGRGSGGRGPSIVQAPPTLPDRAVGSQIAGSAPNRRPPTPYWLDGRGVSVTIVAP